VDFEPNPRQNPGCIMLSIGNGGGALGSFATTRSAFCSERARYTGPCV